MKLSQKEKADRYDALVFAVGMEKNNFDKQLREVEIELTQPQSDAIYSMLIGKKYAFKSFLEVLERWC